MQLYSKEYSTSGPPLIILHGLFGHQGNWAWHARQLAASFSVYGLDARNHGRSAWGETMRYDEMAADVVQTMDALGIDSAAFIGHSMGGKTAMQLALTSPERVESLLVVDIAPVAYDRGPDTVLKALQSVDTDALESRKAADAILSGHIESKAVRDFLLTNLIRGETGFRWRMNLAAIAAGYGDITGPLQASGSYRGRTLFVKGGDSDYLLPQYREQTLELFPRASVRVVEHAGHWVHSEKPQAFLKIALDFL